MHTAATWSELADSLRALADTREHPLDRDAVAAGASAYDALAYDYTAERWTFRFWGGWSFGRS